MELENLFRDIFNLDASLNLEGLSPETVPEWDSLGHLTLMNAIEETYKVSFDFEEMIEIENYNDIVRILKTKGVV